MSKSISLLFWAKIPWSSCKAQFPENGTQQFLDSQAVRRNSSEIHVGFLFFGDLFLFSALCHILLTAFQSRVTLPLVPFCLLLSQFLSFPTLFVL